LTTYFRWQFGHVITVSGRQRGTGWDRRPPQSQFTITEDKPNCSRRYFRLTLAVVDLPATSPYAAMIGHVVAWLRSHADNLIEPASAVPALELTLNVHQRPQASELVGLQRGRVAAHRLVLNAPNR
jgi:hypothetical protein